MCIRDRSETDDTDEKVDTTDLDNIFNSPYHLEAEEAVSLKKNYILSMDVKKT